MADWDVLQKEVTDFAEEAGHRAIEFAEEMTKKIESAKSDELLKAVQDLATRLGKIEAKLEDKDAQKEGDSERPKVR